MNYGWFFLRCSHWPESSWRTELPNRQVHKVDWSIINRPSRATITLPVPSDNVVPPGLYSGQNLDCSPHSSRSIFKVKVIMNQRHGYPFCREAVQASVRCPATTFMKKTTMGIGKWKRRRRSKGTPVVLLSSIFHGLTPPTDIPLFSCGILQSLAWKSSNSADACTYHDEWPDDQPVIRSCAQTRATKNLPQQSPAYRIRQSS